MILCTHLPWTWSGWGTVEESKISLLDSPEHQKPLAQFSLTDGGPTHQPGEDSCSEGALPRVDTPKTDAVRNLKFH